MIPFFIFSAFMVDQLVRLERRGSERHLRREAQKLRVLLDQEFSSVIRTLQALATSLDLEQKDLKSFHQELGRVQKSQPSWETILVHDVTGKMLVTAIREYGETLMAPPEPDSLQEVITTGQPVIGQVTKAPPNSQFSNKYAVAVRVPVFNQGRLTYVLSAIISVDRLQVIANEAMASEWTRTIVDSNGTVAARTRNPEKFIGQPGTPSFVKTIHESFEGLVRETTLDGKTVYLAYDRSPFSAWAVSIAVPVDVLETSARQSRALVVGIGTFILLIFGGLALFYSRRLALRIRSAALGAMDLADGKTPQVASSSVTEVEQLRTSLLTVADLLQERERERNEHLNQAIAARAEAEQANRAKSEFLANMSHELRTPLGVVLGFSELLVLDDITPAERTENLQIIQRNGQHLLRLIDDILDLSKVEARRLTIETLDFSLAEWMTGIMADLKPRAMEKGLEFTLTSAGPLPDLIHTDPIRLRQIIYNLVGNAIKFTASGFVNLHLEAQEDQLAITIRDSGIGLTEEQQKSLFRPFTQADGSHTRKYGGTGLGLALAKRLGELLGGDVQLLESNPGKGSVFQIRVKVR
jgi:signal transduction histidine kinase